MQPAARLATSYFASIIATSGGVTEGHSGGNSGQHPEGGPVSGTGEDADDGDFIVGSKRRNNLFYGD